MSITTLCGWWTHSITTEIVNRCSNYRHRARNYQIPPGHGFEEWSCRGPKMLSCHSNNVRHTRTHALPTHEVREIIRNRICNTVMTSLITVFLQQLGRRSPGSLYWKSTLLTSRQTFTNISLVTPLFPSWKNCFHETEEPGWRHDVARLHEGHTCGGVR